MSSDLITFSHPPYLFLDWYQAVIFEIAIDDLEALDDAAFRRAREQIDFAVKKNVVGVMFKCPQCPRKLNLLASLIEPHLNKEGNKEFLVYIELHVVNTRNSDPWLYWNQLRCHLPPNDQLKLSLNLKNGYPSDQEVQRWAGEPVAIVRHTIIGPAAKVKARFVNDLLRFCVPIAQKREIAMLLDGVKRSDFKFVEKTWKFILSKLSKAFLGGSYVQHISDNPSAPMQPLRDNLLHSEYAVFEEDQMKYALYYHALVDAMVDRIDARETSRSSASSISEVDALLDSGISCYDSPTPERNYSPSHESEYIITKPLRPYEKGWIKYDVDTLIQHDDQIESLDHSGSLTVVVAGAGRGPLVTATLLAAQVAKINKITVHVIEKNPNVTQCLKDRVKTDWLPMYPGASIHIHPVDMRIDEITDLIQGEVDIVVSELLGSFGDNELSPECLGALLSHLNRDVICIPQSYSSYVQPIMSYKCHCKVQKRAIDEGKPPDTYLTSYHSMSFRNYYAASSTLPVWRFTHFPSSDNEQGNPYPTSKQITGECYFPTTISFLCHGFAGYFSAKLYGNIKISTRPENHTKNLPSWYPVYFPLVEPIFVEAGRGIGMKINRRITADETVAYDWQAFTHEETDKVTQDAASSSLESLS